MPFKLFTMDGFRDAAKDGDAPPSGMLLRATSGPAQSIAEDSRTASFIFSDGSVDLMGDDLNQEGWDLGQFKDDRNPVALWSHASWDPPIGRASNVAVRGKKQLVGDITFATADIYPFADTIYKLVKGGFLNAVSVGFVPLEWKFTEDKSRPFGISFVRQRLIEISVCACPANLNALGEARSAGIDTGPITEWAEKLLDGEGRISVPRQFLEDVFKAAKTPRSVRQKYLDPEVMEDVSTWQCAAQNDLPMDKAAAWDGKAAAERMFVAAGFDGDAPDIEMARRGFLVYDSANPTVRSSYKMPFCDIVDGELTAIAAGVTRAIERMPHAAVPDAVADAAKSVLEDYIPRIIGKAGKKVSAANQALLSKAMDLHAQATECVKQVMASNDGPDMEGDMDPDEMPMDPMMDGKMDVSAITAAAIEEAVERAVEGETEVEVAAIAATAAAEAAEVARQLRIRLASAKHTQAMATLAAE